MRMELSSDAIAAGCARDISNMIHLYNGTYTIIKLRIAVASSRMNNAILNAKVPLSKHQDKYPPLELMTSSASYSPSLVALQALIVLLVVS